MSTAERKKWEKAQRRERIVDIAEKVFFTNGYAASTLDMIADAAGYNKRTLYLYFRDKEEMLLAVVRRGLSLLNQRLSAAADSEAPAGRLSSLGRAFFDFTLDHPGYADLIMIYEAGAGVYGHPGSREHPGETGSLRQQCQQLTDANADLVTAAIADGIDRGTIHTVLTPGQLMLILWGQIFGVMQIIQMRREHLEDAFGISHEALFDAFIEMTERALTVAAG